MARRSLAAGWAAAPPAAPSGVATSAPRIGSATHSAMNSTFFIAPQCSSKGGRGTGAAVQASRGRKAIAALRKKGEGAFGSLPRFLRTDLLADRRAGHVRRAGRVGTDHTGLVGEELPLPGGADVRGHGCNRVRVDGATHHSSGREREDVAALGARSQDRVNQVRSRCRGRGCRPQIGQQGRVAGPVGGGVSDASRVDRPQRANRRRFVRRHLRTQQVGDGNRRDDQNDRYDDQKLDERKTLLPVPHTLSFDFYTSTRDTGLLEATAGPTRRGAYTLSAQSPEGP